MKIETAEIHPLRIPRLTPFKVAYATRTECRSILLELGANDVTGWGEAVPVREVTGERYADTLDALRRFAANRLVGADPGAREDLRAISRREMARLPAARCAVDCALRDLECRRLGVPVHRLLGSARTSVLARVSVGIMDARETVASVRNLLALGVRSVKLKIGLGASGDADRVRRVRSELGRDFRVSLDANGGYGTAEAIALLTGLAGEEIEFVEQPVPASDLAGLAEVNRASPIPVCADEAVHGMESLLPILSLKAARLVNVKLQKCGGITEADLMVRTAESAGIGVLLGCMIETRVGISAGLAVALGLANVVHTDLDGANDLAADPVAGGGAKLTDGKQSMDDQPGLGLALDPTVLKKYRDSDPL